MIERQTELKRRYHRKKKMMKWKAKLETATGEARAAILLKIKRLTPSWTEASLKSATDDKSKADPKASKEAKEPKKKAPAKPKAEKK